MKREEKALRAIRLKIAETAMVTTPTTEHMESLIGELSTVDKMIEVKEERASREKKALLESLTNIAVNAIGFAATAYSVKAVTDWEHSGHAVISKAAGAALNCLKNVKVLFSK